MRELFEQLRRERETAIQNLINQRVQENVELEFKTKANPDNGDLTREDPKNLGVALSALSNSMGGVLIWGVSAVKNQDGIDCASALQPISQIERFANEVDRAVSQAIMPRHEGIHLLMIPSSSNPNAGYLALHVERSERRPHRCEFGEKQYFKRIGDSSIAMEHYDIEDSFKRFSAPSLIAEFQLSDGGRRGGPDGNFAIVAVTVSLRNTSNMSAQYPYLKVDATTQIGLPGYNVHRGFQQPPGVFNGGADDVIHPDLSLRALTLQREFPIRQPNYLPRGTLQPPILIEYRCGCLHSRATFGTFEITEQQIAAALNIQII